MQEVKIERVSDNSEKMLTYAEAKRRYKRAVDEGFYFEALLISYALIEDRLTSLLYHIGALEQRTHQRVCRRSKKNGLEHIVRLVDHKGSPDVEIKMSVKGMTNKASIFKSTLRWSQIDGEQGCETDYLRTLRQQYRDRVDVGEAMRLLDELAEWQKTRNEIVHGLAAKNMEALYAVLPSHCEAGMLLFGRLDRLCRDVQHGNRIRRSLKMGCDKKASSTTSIPRNASR